MDKQDLKLESLKIRNYEMYKYFKQGLDIISELKSKTYEAYIVGGAVRDFILEQDFKDIDIATNATPEIIKDVFKNRELDETFSNLGCITIKEQGFRYEITTFRSEEYVKYKIKDVHYSKKLVEDIIRRDYTINALALTPNLTLVDLVEGEKDLEKGIIRIIGSGKRRYKDDPSRILRGLLLMARYGYYLDGTTCHAMKRSRQFLKNISEQKILLYMKKILSEKHGLKALRIIDENNLFKFIPNFAYWVRLLIKNYKKLDYIEKMALLFLISGNVTETGVFIKEELVRINKLIDLTHQINVNSVDQMMVFSIGMDNLLSADALAKAYNRKYHKQKRKIKKINRHLTIHAKKELDITFNEIKEFTTNNVDLANKIYNELLILVINGKLNNKNTILKSEALKLISKENMPLPKTVNVIDAEEKKSIASLFHKKKNSDYEEYKLDKRLFDSVYENYDDASTKFDAWDQIPVNEDLYDESINNSNESMNQAALESLKEEYREDFIQLYNIYIRGVKDFQFLGEFEKRNKSDEIKQEVKQFLLKNNAKYKILEERNMI